jgi:hypothetical protein
MSEYVCRRIALDEDAGAFTYRNRSNLGLTREKPGAVLGHYVDWPRWD